MASGTFWQKHGNAVKIGLVVVGLGFAAWQFRSYIFGNTNDPAEMSRTRYMIDFETREEFPRFRISDGETPPYRNPKTGTRTLVQAEMCWWNTDGSPRDFAKDKPTAVLLNIDGSPTFCPDCGRLVVGHNPAPDVVDVTADGKPVYDLSRVPPTEDDYRRGRRPSGSRE